MIGYIYRIVINDELFFGLTRNLAKEFNKHIKRSKNPILKQKFKLYRDYNNYNFKSIETIQDINDKDLKSKLKRYIRDYNSDYEGLNEIPIETDEEFRTRRNKLQNIYNSNNREACRTRCRELRKKHLENKTFLCELCNRCFESNSQLLIHLSSKNHNNKLNTS